MIPTTQQSNHFTLSFSEADTIDIAVLTESCFYLYGKSVPFAQNLYNIIHNSCVTFEEDCPSSIPKNASFFPTEVEVNLILYPNPNSDIVYFECSDESINDAMIEIIDIDGKSFYSGTIYFERGLDLSALSIGSGIYVVELVIDMNGTPTSVKRKLVYIKK